MLQVQTVWDEYLVTVTEKMRGWDVRRYHGSKWVMSPVSGAGY